MAGHHRENNVPSPVLPSNQKLTFSFEYYDKCSTRYCVSKWTETQIRDTILRLQEVCTKTFNDLRIQRGVYHFNEVDWSQTTEKNGFPNSRVNELPAFHFALLNVNRQLARVFGAYSTGVFYIVWFDLNHEIWPSLLQHT
jgi:hypothetical protein